MIRKLEPAIHARVIECLEGWPCNTSQAEALNVDLEDNADSKTFVIAFAGDDPWGDFGVDVTIADGKVVAADGGD